ncbi:hypothetical protein TNCV_3760011 [Trichonephila clavipes]|nr:hypothetical protein TNCV_3760011 [Trichonephila clavipes]
MGCFGNFRVLGELWTAGRYHPLTSDQSEKLIVFREIILRIRGESEDYLVKRNNPIASTAITSTILPQLFMKPRCLKCGKDHATRNCLTSKNDKKTHFVSTARTSVTRHVILNVPKFPNPKGAAFSDPIKDFFKQMD